MPETDRAGVTNATSTNHHSTHNHKQLVFAYALEALPASELGTVEEGIGKCAECRQELEKFHPIVESVRTSPVDAPHPALSLWERLTRCIVGDSGGRPLLSSPPQRWLQPEWKEAAPGISVKLLATDTHENRVSMLVRFAPGAEYPPHRHGGVEELHMLEGDLMIGDHKLYPGDYRRSEADSIDQRAWTETGCTCVLVTSYDDRIL